jgi:hypothetical protein
MTQQQIEFSYLPLGYENYVYKDELKQIYVEDIVITALEIREEVVEYYGKVLQSINKKAIGQTYGGADRPVEYYLYVNYIDKKLRQSSSSVSQALNHIEVLVYGFSKEEAFIAYNNLLPKVATKI